jgi:hypothetical protein
MSYCVSTFTACQEKSDKFCRLSGKTVSGFIFFTSRGAKGFTRPWFHARLDPMEIVCLSSRFCNFAFGITRLKQHRLRQRGWPPTAGWQISSRVIEQVQCLSIKPVMKKRLSGKPDLKNVFGL